MSFVTASASGCLKIYRNLGPAFKPIIVQILRLHSRADTLNKYGTGRKKKAPLPPQPAAAGAGEPAKEKGAGAGRAARVERSQSDLVASRKPRGQPASAATTDSAEEGSAASKSAKPFLSYKVKVRMQNVVYCCSRAIFYQQKFDLAR